MGGCLYGTAPDYMRLLRMHLNGGVLDETRIVRELLMRSLQQNLIGDIKTGYDFFPGTSKSHAFSYMRLEKDMPGRRAAGSCHWAGGANGHYWIDFQNDLAGILVTYDPLSSTPSLWRDMLTLNDKSTILLAARSKPSQSFEGASNCEATALHRWASQSAYHVEEDSSFRFEPAATSRHPKMHIERLTKMPWTAPQTFRRIMCGSAEGA